MWNERNITPPPVCNLKTIVNAKNRIIFQNLKTLINDAINILSDTSPWETELYVLSRLIYKKTSQRRRDKTLQRLKRIQACIQRYCSISIINYLEDIKNSLHVCDFQAGSTSYLPSRQMVQYILVRLMSMAALLTQTTGYCIHSFIAVQEDLVNGTLIPQTTVFLAIVSRIWALSKSTCLYLVEWYSTLYTCLDHLELTQVPWLHSSSQLPACLKKWLEKFDSRKSQLTENVSKDLEHLSQPETNHTKDEIIRNVTESRTEESTWSIEEEDIGCIISREDISSRRNSNVQNESVRSGCFVNREKNGRSEGVVVKMDTSESNYEVSGHIESDQKRSGHTGSDQNKTCLKNSGIQPLQKQKHLNVTDLKSAKEVKKLLREFKQTHMVTIGNKHIEIRDHNTVKKVRVTLRKCLNHIIKNSSTSENSISRAVRVVTKIAKQVQTRNLQSPDLVQQKISKKKEKKQARTFKAFRPNVIDDTFEIPRKKKLKQRKNNLASPSALESETEHNTCEIVKTPKKKRKKQETSGEETKSDMETKNKLISNKQVKVKQAEQEDKELVRKKIAGEKKKKGLAKLVSVDDSEAVLKKNPHKKKNKVTVKLVDKDTDLIQKKNISVKKDSARCEEDTDHKLGQVKKMVKKKKKDLAKLANMEDTELVNTVSHQKTVGADGIKSIGYIPVQHSKKKLKKTKSDHKLLKKTKGEKSETKK